MVRKIQCIVVITGGMCIFVGLQKKMTSTIWYYGNFFISVPKASLQKILLLLGGQAGWDKISSKAVLFGRLPLLNDGVHKKTKWNNGGKQQC